MDAKLLIAAAVIGATGFSGAALAGETIRDLDHKTGFGKVMSDSPVLSQGDYVRSDAKKGDAAKVVKALIAGKLK